MEIRIHHQFVGLTQHKNSVTCTIDDASGKPYQLVVKYVVGADGHRSRVREALGIARKGHGHVSSTKSVLFRAPALAPYFEKGITQFTIDQPDLKALLLAYRDGRLVLHLTHYREFTSEILRSLIYQAVGKSESEIDIEVLESSRWDIQGLIAEKFRVGRVFLVGDSAHSLPPNRGGYGVNTGIADAHNLAWKLAYVLNGTSTPQLLDTYEAERLPVAWLRHNQIFARSDFKTLQKKDSGAEGKGIEVLDDNAVEFGQLYRSTGILGAEESLPDAQMPSKWAGQPGTRAPHVWIQHDKRIISTLELFGKEWVVVSADESCGDRGVKALEKLPIKVKFVHITNNEFLHAFGLSRGGCSLVRPDGYIAWISRDAPEKSAATFKEALTIVMFLPD